MTAELDDAIAGLLAEEPEREPRRHVLAVPWEERLGVARYGAWYGEDVKMWLVDAAELPEPLLPYASKPYSWERWIEEDLNDGFDVTPPAVEPAYGTVTLRPHQQEAVAAALRAYRAKTPGFLIADDVGLGKTYEAVAAALETGARKILILCPLSVVPGWRLSIPMLDPTGRAKWVVINYDRAKSLLEAPKSAATAKRARTKNKRTAQQGKSIVEWDLVIKDEAHLLSNPQSQRSAAVRRLDGEGTRRRAFSLWLSATAGQTPLALSYLSPVLAGANGDAPDLDEFEAWCARQGISVGRGAYGKWTWERNDSDLEKMRALLFDGKVPAGIRRRPTDIAGWPEQQRTLLPIELTPSQIKMYNDNWSEFREEMGLARRGKNPTNPMVRQMRFRQKASLLRAPGMAEVVKTELARDKQVAVSIEFRESIELLVEAMGSESVEIVHGGVGKEDREAARLRFQRGESRVIAFSVAEGINLQANETAVGGTGTERALIIDPSWSAIRAAQVEGRTHRNGEFSLAQYCYAVNTVDKRVLDVVMAKLRDMKTMQGDDTQSIARDIESVLATL